MIYNHQVLYHIYVFLSNQYVVNHLLLIFDLIGFSDEQKKYFEHMLTAFKYGVPPHGGIAPGIDRLIMVLLGQPSLREVIAFPKNKEAKDVLMDAPSFVDKKQLKDVSIKSDLPKKEKR